MRTILFSSQTYDRDSFTAAVRPESVQLHFQPARLSLDTAALAHGYEVVCPFINDDLSAPVLEQLADGGTQLIALRSAGFNHVDLPAAKRLGLSVVRSTRLVMRVFFARLAVFVVMCVLPATGQPERGQQQGN